MIQRAFWTPAKGCPKETLGAHFLVPLAPFCVRLPGLVPSVDAPCSCPGCSQRRTCMLGRSLEPPRLSLLRVRGGRWAGGLRWTAAAGMEPQACLSPRLVSHFLPGCPVGCWWGSVWSGEVSPALQAGHT